MGKKIVIFGATGMTGLCATEAAVKKGHEVYAFVRDANKLPAHLKDKVKIVVGNVLEPDSVNEGVENKDAVVICLGTRNSLEPSSDMSEGTKNIIDSMRGKNVKVVSACLSAFLFYEPNKVPERFGPITEDHKRMYEALRDSSLNYIAVFPPHIADEPSHEFTTEVNPEKSPGRAISKWDLGQFLVDCLDEPKFYRSIVVDLQFDNPEIAKAMADNIRSFYFGNRTIAEDIMDHHRYFGDHLVLHGLLNSVQIH